MKRGLITLAAAAVLALTGAAPAMASTAAPEQSKEVTFAGTVALSNCSGSVVRLSTSKPADPALVLSNGHCLSEGMPGPGEVIVDQPSRRSFTLLDSSANEVGTLQSTKIVYATMTDTDVSLYQVGSTYADIEQRYGIAPLELSAAHPEAGRAMSVVSGYWKRIYKCNVDTFIYELHEADWVWKDSIRYTPGCDTIGGTSGSPILDDATNQVIGVNNTGNESGGRCTLNNPCEVDENGNVTVNRGAKYGQQTYLFYGCMGEGSEIDLAKPECKLPKPRTALPEAA